jgi:hypothetical protein
LVLETKVKPSINSWIPPWMAHDLAQP